MAASQHHAACLTDKPWSVGVFLSGHWALPPRSQRDVPIGLTFLVSHRCLSSEGALSGSGVHPGNPKRHAGMNTPQSSKFLENMRNSETEAWAVICCNAMTGACNFYHNKKKWQNDYCWCNGKVVEIIRIFISISLIKPGIGKWCCRAVVDPRGSMRRSQGCIWGGRDLLPLAAYE